MTLYASYTAWLHATPYKAEQTRIAEMKQDKIPPAYPPVSWEWVVRYWQDVGLCMSAGGYPHALTWQEISAWQALSGVKMTAWLAETLKKMSAAYVSGLHEFSKEFAECPYMPEIISQEHAQAIERKIERIFS